MHYTIYKIIHRESNKIYIGKHKTDNIDDGYMGSGKHLVSAQNKYGIGSFEKEILYNFDNEQEMNDKEAELVNEEFVNRKDTYNIKLGGDGGWSHVNSAGLNNSNKDWAAISKKLSEINKGKRCPWVSKRLIEDHKNGLIKNYPKLNGTFTMAGKKHSEKSKIKMSKSKIGIRNPQYGTMWITNGIVSKKIHKNKLIPAGWKKGRVLNKL